MKKRNRNALIVKQPYSPPGLKATPNRRGKIAVLASILAAMILTAYYPVTTFDFLDWDDEEYITQNLHVQRGLHSESIAWAFTAFHSCNWHPLTWISHMLDWHLFGDDPGMHHFVNLLIHLFTTLLLFTGLHVVTKRIWVSFFIAAVFSVHPMHVESVAWISERKDLLSALFLVLTIFAYVLYVRRKSFGFFILSLVFFAAGLMSKPMLVSIPLLLVLVDIWPLSRISGDQLAFGTTWKIIMEKVPFAVLSLLSAVVTILAQQRGGAVADTSLLPISARLANALIGYYLYTLKLFWPWPMAAFYPHSVTSLRPLEVVLGIALLACVMVVSFRSFKRHPYVLAGLFWFVLSLVPVIGIVQVGFQAIADRYTYIPYIGLSAVVILYINEIANRYKVGSTLRVWIGMIAVGVMLVGSMIQVRYWKDTATLFEHSVKVTPPNPYGYTMLGVGLERKGFKTKALDNYRRALDIDPAFLGALHNSIVLLIQFGKISEAEGIVKRAEEIAHRNEHVQFVKGNMLQELQRYEEAVAAFEKSLQIRQTYGACFNGGISAMNGGFTEKAQELFRRAWSLDPGSVGPVHNLGITFLNTNQIDSAIFFLEKASALAPPRPPKNFALVYNDLGLAYARKGKTREAILQIRRALEIDPDFALASNNLKALSEQQTSTSPSQ